MDNVELALTRMFLSTDSGVVADACAIKCLKIVSTERVSTAATDGVVLIYNPEYVSKLTLEQTIGLLVHEVCHVRFQHHERFTDSGWLEQDRANVAMDMEINPIVLKAGYCLPPQVCLPSQIGKPDGLSWEEYYAACVSDPPPPQPSKPNANGPSQGEPEPDEQAEAQQPGNGPATAPEEAPEEPGNGENPGEPSQSTGDPEADASGAPDGPADGSQPGPVKPGPVEPGAHAAGSLVERFAPELLDETDDPAELAETVAQQIDDASVDSKLVKPDPVSPHVAGNRTGQNKLQVSQLTIASDCRWQDLVIQMVGKRASGESVTDWSRPNRRNHSSDHYRPSRKRVNGFKLALVIDVSGSCVSYFSAWQSLAQEMVAALPEITELEILYHDVDIKQRDNWLRRDGDEVKIQSRGGGGTCHRKVLYEVEKLDVDGCVLFTDSESYWPSSFSVDCVTVQPPGSYATTPFGHNIRISNW